MRPLGCLHGDRGGGTCSALRHSPRMQHHRVGTRRLSSWRTENARRASTTRPPYRSSPMYDRARGGDGEELRAKHEVLLF
jgi:hypothetical protein